LKEKLKDDKYAKELLFKFIFALSVAIVALLLINVMNINKDGRSQIIDEDGATEYLETGNGPTREEARLALLLSEINGVGTVDVMISYESNEEKDSIFSETTDKGTERIRGVIITAAGAESPIIKNNLMHAVATLFDIPIQKVIVFEKNEEGL
jgi:hypothetical protein